MPQGVLWGVLRITKKTGFMPSMVGRVGTSKTHKFSGWDVLTKPRPQPKCGARVSFGPFETGFDPENLCLHCFSSSDTANTFDFTYIYPETL
jgi:hypothetical protein